MISIDRLNEITECGFYCSKNDVERIYIYEVIKNTDEKWLKENPEATLLIDGWIYDHTDYDDRKVYCTGGNLNAICNDFANCKVYKIEDTKYKKYGNCGQFLIEDKPIYNEQLQAKEQECKDLREDIKDIANLLDLDTGEEYNFGNIELEIKHLKAKKQECEKAKEFANAKITQCANLIKQLNETHEQLDQLKADNDSLKSELMQTNCYLEADKETIDQLESENEELKKQACGLRPELKYIIDKTCCKYNINAKYYHEKIVEIINNLDKYNQTLTEIKEILKEICMEECSFDWNKTNKKHCGDCDCRYGQILQKFREVIPDEN